MKLFIAEKPSVAKAIAAELGVSGRGDGFINCRNDVVVTWCFGHLLEQAEPDAYLPDDIPKTKKGRKIWRMQDLPIFPQHWLMEAKSERGAKKQLSVIGKLLKSAATGATPTARDSSSSTRCSSTSGPDSPSSDSGFRRWTPPPSEKASPSSATTAATRACATPRADAPAPTGCSA